LQSAAWRNTRARRLLLAEHRCEFRRYDSDPKHGGYYGDRCAATTKLEVHHLNYETVGAERDADLEVLCQLHHILRHVERAKCERCGDAVFHHEADALSCVMNAVEDYGTVELTLDMVDVPDVCDYCDHMLTKDD
jgi:hypothetical protein